ncbi:MAG: sigma-54-dependent Fis family transcriptional regulator [candidate division NC10 bacterium]|nr:sigma-54-dependent Fis family transcriptional regulator [candidate division NC10 bacterium]
MPRILVVDDEPGMRRSLAISLKREGYEVEEAPGGTEALLRLEREIYDLVMTDLKMGPVGGLEVLAAVKKGAPQTEVIVMTAYGSIEAAVDAMRLGAFDFVTKPFQAQEILTRVRNALEKTRLTTEVRLLRGDPKSRVGYRGPPPAGGSQEPGRLRAAPGTEPGDAGRYGKGRAGRGHREHDPHHGGKRDGEGTRGPGDPCPLASGKQALRLGQLRRLPRAAAGERTLRTHQGRLHRGGREPEGPPGGGPRGHLLLRRGG